MLYYIEVTDTFGSEANYSWVRRYKTEAKSFRGAITKLAKHYGSGWRNDMNCGDFMRYVIPGSCVCAFVSCADEFTPDCQTI